jgi:hypothetical protein
LALANGSHSEGRVEAALRVRRVVRRREVFAFEVEQAEHGSGLELERNSVSDETPEGSRAERPAKRAHAAGTDLASLGSRNQGERRNPEAARFGAVANRNVACNDEPCVGNFATDTGRNFEAPRRFGRASGG